MAKKRSYREGWHFKREHISPPSQPLSLEPFQVTVSAQFTRTLPELCSTEISSTKLSFICTTHMLFSNVTPTFSCHPPNCLASVMFASMLVTPLVAGMPPRPGPTVVVPVSCALPHPVLRTHQQVLSEGVWKSALHLPCHVSRLLRVLILISASSSYLQDVKSSPGRNRPHHTLPTQGRRFGKGRRERRLSFHPCSGRNGGRKSSHWGNPGSS